jgi:type I restriction enzyme S subunit
LQTGDLLFSIAGTIGRVSIVPKELDNSNSNQALAFIRPKDDIKTYFLLQFLKSQEVQDEISSRVVQAVQANVSLTELGSLKFATASDDLFRKWHSIVQSWIDKINLLQMENSHLSKLRDTLLPKLMSGELRIADAAALVDKTI